MRSHSIQDRKYVNLSSFSSSSRIPVSGPSCRKSISRMKQRAIEGWPDHWYNRDGYIPCPARGCTMVFHDGNITGRGHHWYGPSSSTSPIYNDHGILLAINRQQDCVHCGYHNDISYSLTRLLAHEQDVHGCSHMSTIQGYLSLMRHGLITDEARVCSDHAFQSLLYNVWNSPYRRSLLRRAYPHLLPHEADMWRDLEPMVAYQNFQARRPHSAVILARDFLTHLHPRLDDRSSWPAIYHELRARYANGSI